MRAHAWSILLGLGAVLVAAAPVAARPSAPTVKVAFLQGEQTVTVERAGSSAEDAVRGLLAGPSAAEAKRGMTTQVPTGTPLRSVRQDGAVVTVDVGEKFVQGLGAESLSARLAQLVMTATAVPGVKAVRLLVKGGTPLGLFPGYATSRPLTASAVRTPEVPPPVTPAPTTPKEPSTGQTRALQEQLSSLGYLDPAGVDGRAGEQTSFAVVAFQKWEGLQRDGIAGPATLAALARSTRPTPVTAGAGHRVEVLLDRQLVLVIDDDVVTRTITVSSGKTGYETLSGRWKIQRKYVRDWSVPYKVWLPYASYFVGGYAFHEYPDVPTVPASHGCVRTPRYDIKWLYANTPIGTPVTVLTSSR